MKLSKLLETAIIDIGTALNSTHLEVQNAISLRLIALSLEQIAIEGVKYDPAHNVDACGIPLVATREAR